MFGFQAICIQFRTFICSDCKSAHQAYSHRCKSATMSNWTMEEVQSLDEKNGGGNKVCLERYFAKCSEKERPKTGCNPEILKRFVTRAYDSREWEDRNWRKSEGPPPPAAPPRQREREPVARDKTKSTPAPDLLDFDSAPAPQASPMQNPVNQLGDMLGGGNGSAQQTASWNAFGTTPPAATGVQPNNPGDAGWNPFGTTPPAVSQVPSAPVNPPQASFDPFGLGGNQPAPAPQTSNFPTSPNGMGQFQSAPAPAEPALGQFQSDPTLAGFGGSCGCAPLGSQQAPLMSMGGTGFPPMTSSAAACTPSQPQSAFGFTQPCQQQQQQQNRFQALSGQVPGAQYPMMMQPGLTSGAFGSGMPAQGCGMQSCFGSTNAVQGMPCGSTTGMQGMPYGSPSGMQGFPGGSTNGMQSFPGGSTNGMQGMPYAPQAGWTAPCPSSQPPPVPTPLAQVAPPIVQASPSADAALSFDPFAVR